MIAWDEEERKKLKLLMVQGKVDAYNGMNQ